MRWAILDSNVYIDYWERGDHEALLEKVRRAFIVRHSSVVLSELRRGARTVKAQRLVTALYKIAAVRWAPLAEDWWTAGRIIRKIGDDAQWDTRKRQAFQNDALIALTARRHGATVVTTNETDFRLLSRELNITILSSHGR